MNARFLISTFVFLSCICLLSANSQAQHQSSAVQSPSGEGPKNNASPDMGPVVNDWQPKTGSINSIIELRGYRLHPDAVERAKVFFIQNGIEIRTVSSGGTSITNDQLNGAQTLEVIVPENAAPGSGQFVVELNGRRSRPAIVEVTEWKAPVVKSLTPTSGSPGTVVNIECEGFHIYDELELTDVAGKQVRFDSGGSSKGTIFRIPEDAQSGVLTVRIGNTKYGKGQYSEAFTFTVTNDPAPLESITPRVQPIAPGQWLDLQASSNDTLKHSERTEVSFKQAGRTIVGATPKPFRPHVEVPTALSPGKVELQARTWRDGRPSQWSEPIVISLADKPVAPEVSAIRLENGSWVQLWPGPDRATSFRVAPGDVVVMNGRWRVADASKLKVSLVRMGEVIALTAAELDEKAEWFSEVHVRLPKSLGVGDWRMLVSSETDGAEVEVPLVITVSRNQ